MNKLRGLSIVHIYKSYPEHKGIYATINVCWLHLHYNKVQINSS